MTGTSTWLTLVTILQRSSVAPPCPGVAPPSGTVVIFIGGRGGGASAAGAGAFSGFASPGGVWLGGAGLLSGAALGNGWGGCTVEGASGIPCFCSGCCASVRGTRANASIASQPALACLQITGNTAISRRQLPLFRMLRL